MKHPSSPSDDESRPNESSSESPSSPSHPSNPPPPPSSSLPPLRILCLHDEHSSGFELIRRLKRLGERLHHDHNIELAFVNAPHNSNRNVNGNTNTNEGKGKDKDSPEEEEEDVKRVWYHDHHHDHQSQSQQLVGLDASILHLRQIWSQSSFFSGVLGIGQGAAIAAMLPLLRYEDPLGEDDGDEDEDDGDDDNGGDGGGKMMFDGIRFCIFVDGWDILQQGQQKQTQTTQQSTSNYDDQGTDADTDTDTDHHQVYDDVRDNIASLHIYPKKKNKRSSQSHSLYQSYGGECEGDGDGDGTSTSSTSCIAVNHDHEPPTKINGLVMNAIGKFVVSQKKLMVSQEKRFRRQIQLQVQQMELQSQSQLQTQSQSQLQQSNHSKEEQDHSVTNTKTNANIDTETNHLHNNHDHGVIIENLDRDGARLLMERTRMELTMVERKAMELMNVTVAENPPKALMAVITPDASSSSSFGYGTLVGGWSGEKDAFRSEGFKKSGGAPCPKEFTLKSDER